MPKDRSTFIGGPAVISWDSSVFYTKDPIKVDIKYDTEEISVSAYGKVDEFVKNRRVEVTFTPVGAFANRAKLWPYASTAMGASLFGSTDKPLTIWTVADGKKYTFTAAAITKMPSITLSATKTICGSMTFSCIQKNNDDWADAAAIESESTVAFNDTSFDTADLVSSTYSAVWGTVTGFTALESIDGFTIDFNMNIRDVETDSEGLVDMKLAGLSVSCKFRPLGPTVANIIAAMKLQDTGAARGMRLSAIQSATNLVISGSAATKPMVTIYAAQLVSQGLGFDLAQDFRLDECEFVATRSFAAGVPNALFAVGVVSA